MENQFVNAFVALEPSTGKDGFSTQQNPRRAAAFFQSRVGVNRLFRSNLAFLSDTDAMEVEESEAASFVVDQFIRRPVQG